MSIRCGSIEDMSENDSIHVRYSVFTLQQANTNKIEKKTLLKLAFMQFTFKVHGVVVRVVVWVGGWVGKVVYVRVWVSGGGFG